MDAEEVVRRSLSISGLTVVALVPNLKGAERGVALSVNKLNFVMSVSRTHNLKNVRRESAESMADFRRIVDLAKAQAQERRSLLVGGLSTALGCSYEGRIPVDDVRRYAAQYAEAGADEISVADTVGYGDPAQVHAVFSAVKAETCTKLLAVREILSRNLPGVDLHGAIAKAGLPKNYVSAASRLLAAA